MLQEQNHVLASAVSNDRRKCFRKCIGNNIQGEKRNEQLHGAEWR